MRVLLVEDDEMIGQSLRKALESNGWSVDWVKEGLLAQSAMADGGYACVLLDLGLPRRDGIEVLRTARDGLDDRMGASTSAPTTTFSSPTNPRAAGPHARRDPPP